MKSFATKNGDVVVGKTIEMVEGTELLQQKVERVLGTNQGEWNYDAEEGIDFSVILRKNPDDAEIRVEIEQALIRIDETFVVTEYNRSMNGRSASIAFKAVNGKGQEVGGVIEL